MSSRAPQSSTFRPIVLIVVLLLVGSLAVAFAYDWPAKKISYSAEFATTSSSSVATVIEAPPVFQVTHMPTPVALKAVYLTSWAAGNDKFRKELFDIVDNTEVNAVVIDIKDYTGHLSFRVKDPELAKFGAEENRIPDIEEFIGQLHDKGVYVIGRISSFQDSFLIKAHPEWAVKTEEGTVWQDYKGIKWLDAGATPVWDYLALIGTEAYARGFDELNFDYIRYPSDGNLTDIAYDWSKGKTRAETMNGFYTYLHDKFSPLGIPISADLFGLTTSAADDLGIGQVLTDAVKQFDYVAPMVYPSHFATGYLGFVKPAQHPYDVVKYAMDHAITKAEEASTTADKIRPWLQAFDLGAIYTPAMVRAQIQATNDAGLSSWMLWDAGSIYDKNDLVPKSEELGTTTEN